MAETCPFQKVSDPEVGCEYQGTETMIGFHIQGQHKEKENKKENKKEEKKEETEKPKKGKRIDMKPPKFMEFETRGEFRRKEEEFQAYIDRTDIKNQEIADDLYRICDTPLKKKFIASQKIEKMINTTKPEVMMKEIKRLCLPEKNVVLEQQEFRKI